MEWRPPSALGTTLTICLTQKELLEHEKNSIWVSNPRNTTVSSRLSPSIAPDVGYLMIAFSLGPGSGRKDQESITGLENFHTR